MLGRWLKRLRGDPTEHDLRPYVRLVDKIEALAAALAADDDAVLVARAAALRQRASTGVKARRLRVELFALAREAARRTLGLQMRRGQLIAGLALADGRMVQMQTGEGKTLAAVPAAALAAVSGGGVHLLTFNDYLARRDADWMGPVYRMLGLTVAAIGADDTPEARRAAYAADVTYLTCREAGFDWLRDQLATEPAERVHRRLRAVIVDEADSLLIDEARIPMVIAGPTAPLEFDAAAICEIAAQLQTGAEVNVDEHGRNVYLTDEGVTRAEALLGLGALHTEANRDALAALHEALHARVLLQRDVDYIVADVGPSCGDDGHSGEAAAGAAGSGAGGSGEVGPGAGGPGADGSGAVGSGAGGSGEVVSGAVGSGAVGSGAGGSGGVGSDAGGSDAGGSGAVGSGAGGSGGVGSDAGGSGGVGSDAGGSGGVGSDAGGSGGVGSDAGGSGGVGSDADGSGADVSGAVDSGEVVSGADGSGAASSGEVGSDERRRGERNEQAPGTRRNSGRQAAAREARVPPRGRPSSEAAARSADASDDGRQQRGILLVDELTGRVAEGRRWPHGLQAAVEAKEGLAVQPRGEVLGQITVQHMVQLYGQLAGMTATAEAADDELGLFYKLRVVVIPPHRPCVRIDHPDQVYSDAATKHAAIVAAVGAAHARRRPVLVGTASVREAQQLSTALAAAGVPHERLDARHPEAEAAKIAGAGGLGAVTIATNMAGRGCDIPLGGADGADREAVIALGGLLLIGANRHESRRVDDQLRGRAGRQGEPGETRYMVGLDDDLFRRYRLREMIPEERWPVRRAEPTDDPLIAHKIAHAQRVIEGEHTTIRRTLFGYSSLLETQRAELARRRDAVLGGAAGTRLDYTLPDRWAAWCEAVGEDAAAAVERRLTLAAIDRAWAEHLDHADRLRETIHLSGLVGRHPLDQYHNALATAFVALRDRVDDRIARAFARLPIGDVAAGEAAARLRRPGATWTYLCSDRPHGEWLQRIVSGLARRLTGG